jgi:hypothetical protein
VVRLLRPAAENRHNSGHRTANQAAAVAQRSIHSSAPFQPRLPSTASFISYDYFSRTVE